MQVTELSAEGLKHQFKIVVPASDLTSKIDERLAEIQVGDPLSGAPEPLKSVSTTKDGRRLVRQRSKRTPPARKPAAALRK